MFWQHLCLPWCKRDWPLAICAWSTAPTRNAIIDSEVSLANRASPDQRGGVAYLKFRCLWRRLVARGGFADAVFLSRLRAHAGSTSIVWADMLRFRTDSATDTCRSPCRVRWRLRFDADAGHELATNRHMSRRCCAMHGFRCAAL